MNREFAAGGAAAAQTYLDRARAENLLRLAGVIAEAFAHASERQKRRVLVLAAVAAAMGVATAAALPPRSSEPLDTAPPLAPPARIAALQHDPQFILEAVAKRMGVVLRPDIPPPTIRLESGTPLAHLQAAAERQWGFRPEVFTTTFATASNEVYLIDEAALYHNYGGTLDDSLAHEFVHYIQARYLGDRFTTDWSETEAVAVQSWFRREYMEPRLAAGRN